MQDGPLFCYSWGTFSGRGGPTRPNPVQISGPEAPKGISIRSRRAASSGVERRRESPGSRRPPENSRRFTFVGYASIRFVFRVGQVPPRGNIIKRRVWRLISVKYSRASYPGNSRVSELNLFLLSSSNTLFIISPDDL